MKPYEPVEIADFDDENAHDDHPVVERPNGIFADFRWKVGKFINHNYTQFFLMGCIVLNSITLGLSATDFVVEQAVGNHWSRNFIDAVDETFLVIFTLESLMQFIYYGTSIVKHHWLCFDTIIVIVSWLTENMSFFRTMKVRAFRVLRALRLFHIGQMHVLLAALKTVAPQLGVIFLFFLLMLYIFGVLFTQLFKPFPCGHARFDRLDASIFTLLQMATLDFATPMRKCMKDVTWAWIPFVLFVFIMGFGMFNLLVAVVCEAMVEINPNENEKQKRFRVEQILKIKLAKASRGLSEAINQQARIEQHLQFLSRFYLHEDLYQVEEDFFHHVMKNQAADLSGEESSSTESNNAGDWAVVAVRRPNGIYAMERHQIGLIINSVPMNFFILGCICINSLCMGVSSSVQRGGKVEEFLYYLDKVFLVIFSIESGMQVFYQGFYIYRDRWSTFDLFIVITSWALEGVAVFRGFRVIRAVRIGLRVGPMKTLLNAFLKSLAALSAITLLSLLMMYIFAVLFTQLYKDLEKGPGSELSYDYYTRLDNSLLTLLQVMTLDFATPMREIMKQKPNAWLPHVLFVIIMGLLFFNLMAGVVCEAVQHDDEEDRKEPERISRLSFRLRCISFQVTLLANTKHNLHQQIQVFQNLYEQKYGAQLKSLKKNDLKAPTDHETIQSTQSSQSVYI